MLKPGPRNLITDVDGLLVGNAEDGRLRSGVSVVLGERPFVASVDVRGGAPGSRETDLLDPSCTVDRVDAICLSGGSAFGLGASDGTMRWLRERGRGVPVGARRLAAESVDRPAPRGEDDPALRARREPGPRPALHGDGARVLDRLLGDVDVAEDADEDGHRAAVLGAEDTLDLRRGRHRGRQ